VFIAQSEDSSSTSQYSTSLSSSSSSDPDPHPHGEKKQSTKKKATEGFTGLCLHAGMAASFYTMAINSDTDGTPSSTAEPALQPKPSSEVRPEHPTPQELEDLYTTLDNQDLIIKDAKRQFRALKSELKEARLALDVARSAPVVEDCEEEVVCGQCITLITDLSELRGKYALNLSKLEEGKKALYELKSRPTLLGACKECPTLRKELEEKKIVLRTLEKSAVPSSSSVDCTVCPSLISELEEAWTDMTRVEEENAHLRTILSSVSAREPQLGMMVQQFKRADGVGVGFAFTPADFDHPYGKIGEMLEPSVSAPSSSTAPPVPKPALVPKPAPVKDGILSEPPRAPPKNPVWVPKPNHLKNPLDTLPPSRKPTLKPKVKSKVRTQPPRVPQRAPAPTPQHTHKRESYQCEWCHRSGHLAEFCFRRLRFERRQSERHAPEVSHPVAGGHAPARCGQRRDVRPRRVGG